MSRAPLLYGPTGQPLAPVATRRRADYAPGGYSGAGYSIARSWITNTVGDHPREYTAYTRTELARKAMFFKKNFGMVRGVAKSLVDHAIGPGVFSLPAAADPTWSPADLDAWNARAWAWLMELAKIAEVSGRMTLWEAQRVRTAAKFWVGGMFTLHTTSAQGWPQFQIIRAHNCASIDLDDADGWTDGVRTDSVGRATAYRFRLRNGQAVTVPARSVIHSYLLEEGDQIREVTPLAHAINNLHDILDSLALEKGAVKDSARISRVVTTESGELEEEPSTHFGRAPATADEADELRRVEEVFGPEVKHLKIGEKLEQWISSRPSPTFTGFLDYLGRDITAGTGFPYEFAWNPSGITGPAVRFVLQKVRHAVDEWRRNEIEDTAPFVTFALATAIKNDFGGLGRAPADWWRMEWIGGAEDVTIDGARDAANDRENIKAALDTFKRYYARRGLWWKTELEQKGREAGFIDEVAKRYGVSVDRIHQLAVNQPAAPAAPAADNSGSGEDSPVAQL
jgi:capsid protein